MRRPADVLRAGSSAGGAAGTRPHAPLLAHAPKWAKGASGAFYRFKLGTIEITVAATAQEAG